MSKKLKTLIILLVIALLLFLYLVLTSESLKEGVGNQISDVGSQLDKTKEQLSADYKTTTGKIIADYPQLTSEEGIATSEVAYIKNRLLDLKVPAEFKDLHLKLVLALTKIENYLKNGDKEKKLESERLINEAKLNYDWLNK